MGFKFRGAPSDGMLVVLTGSARAIGFGWREPKRARGISSGVLECPLSREGRTGGSRGLGTSREGLGGGPSDGPGALLSMSEDGM
jgi:hypothetical protein